jgi:hypothetical protein
MIFQRGAGQAHAVAGVQLSDRRGGPAAAILDGLGLVEDQQVEGLRL